ncbi:MAG TPA: D-glycero-beta-D-manno-heptose-7-phosphate kinase [Pyrinomonadaceae bacterium]|nr:D-glycero-beta-D-manno-heptose-7-phosphate kinase [Pyrinomonadaceae bacterium]
MDLLNNFKNVTILVVGDVMLDRYLWGDVSRISPEAPVPVVRLRRSTFAPGGAANVAANIAGLGARAMLIGCVGTDHDAGALNIALEECNVSAEYLIGRPDMPTNVKTRIIAHNQQVVRVDQEHTENISAVDEDAICNAVSKAMPDADIVIVSDYQKGLLTAAVLRHIFDIAKAHSRKVIVDPKGRDYSKYAGASMLTPNRREAAEASKLDEDDAGLIESAGRRLISDLGLEAVLITRSHEGMSLFIKDRPEIHLLAEAKEIFDVTGAGDTVIATLAASLAGGCNYAQAAAIANIAAGIVVEQVGTTSITLERLARAAASADLSQFTAGPSS